MIGLKTVCGDRWQKSHGTISRCDALEQGTQKKQVGGDSKRMSPEWVKLSWGLGGHPWTSLGDAAFTRWELRAELSLEKVTGPE